MPNRKDSNVIPKNKIKPLSINTPPDQTVNTPPIETRPQELPFNKLTWDNFERFCFRLASYGTQAEHWETYGRPGQAQRGIDVFIRRNDGKYDFWQCKRYQSISVNDIKKLVKTFEDGKWKSKTHRFILCTSAQVNDAKIQDCIESEAKRLKEIGITFLVYGGNKLSEKVKSIPELVDDFFGRNWVKVFCGKEGLNKLKVVSQVLDGAKIIELRKSLLDFYTSYFQTLDHGLIHTVSPNSDQLNLPSLIERYVIPDILNSEARVIHDTPVRNENDENNTSYLNENDDHYQNRNTLNPSDDFIKEDHRQSLQSSFSSIKQICILGEAGSGKSTLLRCLALDILSNQSLFPELIEDWGQLIPIIIPFARWTKAIEDNADAQLVSIIQKWMRSYSLPEDLIELIPSAFKDRRLFLLVDGLDEWSNETAARTALDRLETIINNNNIAAITTGRPRGIEQLKGLGYPWKVFTLAPLSSEQQKKLVSIWFEYSSLHKSSSSLNKETITWQVNNFFKDLNENSNIQVLTGIPLLLTGLITLYIRQVTSLPRNRFQAYKELTRLLLEIHPKTRTSAANDTTSRFIVLDDIDTRQRVLGRLAYEIHNEGADSGYPTIDAQKLIIRFLRDEEVLELPTTQARKGANELLAVNSETSGILIAKSPNEIGFTHAIFKEYLAATYLTELPLDEQADLVSQNCANPRWHNLILSFFYQLTRPSDIDELIKKIEEVELNETDKILRQQLLAELAFSEIRLKLPTANHLAKEVFDKIDTGYWMPERKALLKLSLLPVRPGSFQERQKKQIKRWYPETQWSRDRLFNALSKWEKSPSLLEALWRGMFDSDLKNRMSSSKAIAKVYAGDITVEKRIIAAIKKPYIPEIIASLLSALSKGWKESPQIKDLINYARNSEDDTLRVEGIFAAISMGIQTEEDRDTLLQFSYGESSLNNIYDYHNNLSTALLNGWEKDSVIFETSFKNWEQNSLSSDISQKVLLLGYAENKKVINKICSLLRDKESRIHFMSNEPWDYLNKSYKRNSKVASAVDDFILSLKEEDYRERERALAALVFKSKTAKRCLIDSLDHKNSFKSWAVKALLEGWGMNDKEVHFVLTGIVETENMNFLSNISYYLPEIIKDKSLCRAKLLEILNQDKIRRPDSLVSAFRSLNIKADNRKIIDKALTYVGVSEISDTTNALITSYPEDAKVKKLVFELIGKHKAPLATIAYMYRNESAFSEAILDYTTPLPAILRHEIVSNAERQNNESSYLKKVLSDYSNEYDALVRTAAESSFYARLSRLNKVDESVKKVLFSEIHSRGFDYETVRQAGLAGVIKSKILNDLLLEEKPENDSLTIPALTHSYKQNTLILKLVAENWGYLSKELGEKTVSRLSSFSSEEQKIPWDMLSPYINESSELIEKFKNYCLSTKSYLSENEIRALSNISPYSSVLKMHCLKLIEENKSYIDLHIFSAIQAAATILGNQFSSSKEIVSNLEALVEVENDGAVIALSLISPESTTLKKLYNNLTTPNSKINLRWVAWLHLISSCGDTNIFENVVCDKISRKNEQGSWGFHHECIDPIVRRLAMDKVCYDRLFERIKSDNATANEIASISRLLSRSNSRESRNSELREWCEDEVIKQQNKLLPENGFDLISGRMRPVIHTLYDILIPYI